MRCLSAGEGGGDDDGGGDGGGGEGEGNGGGGDGVGGGGGGGNGGNGGGHDIGMSDLQTHLSSKEHEPELREPYTMRPTHSRG